MRIGEAFPSNYLKHEDLQGRCVQVVMDYVKMEDMRGEHGNEQRPVLYFRGHEKGLVLNKTNSLTIAEMYGEETDAWHGQPIVLYVDNNVRFAGRRVSAIRVDVPPKGPAAQTGNGYAQATGAPAPVARQPAQAQQVQQAQHEDPGHGMPQQGGGFDKPFDDEIPFAPEWRG